jgi:hypothetical protein
MTLIQELIVRNCPSPMLELELDVRLGHNQKGSWEPDSQSSGEEAKKDK